MGSNKTATWLQNRRDEIKTSDYSDTVSDAIILFLDAYNPDSLHCKPPIQQGKDARESTLSTSSRLAYASTLHNTAQQFDLLNVDATALNRYANKRLQGSAPETKDSGVSQNTVHQNQIAWRSFYRFHHTHTDGYDVTVDPDALVLVDRDDTKVDERDMFTTEDIQAMRDATQNKRDRAIIEMLLYTGQRNSALRQLQCKDVQPQKGASGLLYLPDADGLKGAEGKRPLLGAQKAAREWKQAHPTGDPDHYFFTHIYDWSGHDDIEPGDQLSIQAFIRIPQRIASRAGVEKDANPHQFRHVFAHTAIADYGMSMDTVRHLLGHNTDSRELERTYQHLVDDDYIATAEDDMGIQQKEDKSFTPPQCPTCNEPLDSSWSVCPNCEAVFGPDAQSVTDEIQADLTESAFETTDTMSQEEVRTLQELANNPKLLNQLVDLVGGEDDPI